MSCSSASVKAGLCVFHPTSARPCASTVLPLFNHRRLWGRRSRIEHPVLPTFSFYAAGMVEAKVEAQDRAQLRRISPAVALAESKSLNGAMDVNGSDLPSRLDYIFPVFPNDMPFHLLLHFTPSWTCRCRRVGEHRTTLNPCLPWRIKWFDASATGTFERGRLEQSLLFVA